MTAPFKRRVAGFALGAFLIGLWLPFAGAGHLEFNDDSACGVDSLGAPRGAQIQAPVAVNPLQHCAICHLQRATSGAAPAAPIDALRIARRTDRRIPDDTSRIASAPPSRQPARAPPTLVLS